MGVAEKVRQPGNGSLAQKIESCAGEQGILTKLMEAHGALQAWISSCSASSFLFLTEATVIRQTEQMESYEPSELCL
jgi:hypothetical protein